MFLLVLGGSIVGSVIVRIFTRSPKVVRVGVAVLLFHEGKILLGYRQNTDVGAGTYQCPGGHLEFGESIQTCSARELFEETNLEGRNGFRIVCMTENYYRDKRKHYVTIWVTGNVLNRDALVQKLEKKCRGWAWYSTYNLPDPLFEASNVLTPESLDAIVKNSLTALAPV